MSDRVKELLQQAIELIEEQELHITAEMLPAGRVLVEEIKSALSQQAEPECRCTMRQRLVGDGCSVCNPEYAADHEAGPCEFHDSNQADCQQYSGQVPCGSAPAQDERARQLLAELSRTPQDGEKVTRERMAAICEVGHDRAAFIARLARPVQTEQQPVAWRWMYNGEPDGPYAFNYPLPDDDVVWSAQMADRPRTVQPLYAAPTTQTAPQPVGEMISNDGDIYWTDRHPPMGSKLYSAPIAQTAPQQEQSEWISVEDRLPESGRHVLAYYTNSLAKGRRIRAEYVAPKSREVDWECADLDTQCVEHDEESDCFYLTSGWYELMDNWDEYTSIAVVEVEVTHWMPLPSAPAILNATQKENDHG